MAIYTEKAWLRNLYRKMFGSKIYAGKGLAHKFMQEKVWLKNLYMKKVWLKNLYRKSLAQTFIQEKLWLKNLYRKRFGSKICTGKDLAQKCLLAVELSTSHSDTPHSVGRLWTSDRPVAEASTWRHTYNTGDKHPHPRRDSDPQSQQATGCKPPP